MGTQVVAGEDLLRGLNPQQLEAVSLTWGPSLIVAGAGSGKTTVLTRRVAYLVSTLAVDPLNILAVTFTNKAAGEMKHRLESLLGIETARRLWIGTFHSICARLLRRDIESYTTPEGLSWKNNFVIYDETDSLSLVKSQVSKLNLDEKVFAPAKVRHEISSLKNDGYSAYRFAQQAKNYKDIRTAEIFSAYQSELSRNNALDFDDLILFMSELLKQNSQVLSALRQQFKHVLVDEFQDTNQSQYELVRLLAGQSSNENWQGRSLLVVGDVDQSIYSWRKADFRIILGFQKDFKDSKLIKLEENYRSTGTILEVANSIIENNSQRIDKVLRCNRGQGGKAHCFDGADEIDEAYFVVEELKKLMARGKSLNQCVILYRTNAQSRAIEEVLVRNHLPYTMVGGTRFYDRLEIKDLIAYLKLIFNGADGQSFLRVVNQPRRGLGKTTIERLVDHAVDKNISLLEAAANAELIADVSAKNVRALRDFAAMVNRWQMFSATMTPAGLIELVLSETKYIEKLEEEMQGDASGQGKAGDPLAGGRIENLRELVGVAREFEEIADNPNLESFLTRISLVSDLDSASFDQASVKLMTLHSAKGLEFEIVFLMGLEEGLLPHIRSLNSPSDLEEERRLMYVGVTRAADQLYLSYARRRFQFGGTSGSGTSYTVPSRFLKEISPALLQGFYPPPESTYKPAAQWANSESAFTASNESGIRPYGNSKPRAMRIAPPPLDESPEPVAFERLQVGDRVQHSKFGIGQITQIIGEKDKELYNVDFAGAGKRLLDPRFAKLVKLN